jgi:cyclophilin family peptidyl-prolyl cis-trans isomerase
MKLLGLLVAIGLLVASCSQPAASRCSTGEKPVAKRWSAAPEMKIDPNKSYTALLKTNQGDVKIELLAKESPQTVNNFVFLAREGFYDCVKFHRVIKGFMIQGGDPTGTGTGGPGYRFNDELAAARANGYKRGIVAMANAGPNTNGSQFFIMHADYPLPPNYSVFGRVVSGMDAVDKIATTQVGGAQNSSPASDMLIESVTIEEA